MVTLEKTLIGAAVSIAIVVFALWVLSTSKRQQFLEDLLLNFPWHPGPERWKKFGKRSQGKIKEDLCEYVQKKDPYPSSLLLCLNTIDILGIGDAIDPEKRKKLAEKALKKELSFGAAAALAKKVWGNSLPADLAKLLLQDICSEFGALLPLAPREVLIELVREYALNGIGQRLLIIREYDATLVNEETIRICLEQAKDENTKVECILVLQDWELAEATVDTLKDEDEAGRLLLAMRRAQGNTLPAT